jgi:hypothetical protein
MERVKGFYWVKFFSGSDWVICEWIGHCWLYSRTGMSEKFYDLQMFMIDEERIIRNESK